MMETAQKNPGATDLVHILGFDRWAVACRSGWQ